MKIQVKRFRLCSIFSDGVIVLNTNCGIIWKRHYITYIINS